MSTIVRAFNTRSEAARAVDELMSQGFAADDIAVHDKRGKVADLTSDDAGVPVAPLDAGLDLDSGRDEGRRRTREDIRRDDERGGIVPVLGVAPAVSGSASDTMGASATGGYAGGLIGYFVSEGLSEEDARRRSDEAQAGKYLVSVRTNPGNEVQAEAAMATAGALPPR